MHYHVTTYRRGRLVGVDGYHRTKAAAVAAAEASRTEDEKWAREMRIEADRQLATAAFDDDPMADAVPTAPPMIRYEYGAERCNIPARQCNAAQEAR